MSLLNNLLYAYDLPHYLVITYPNDLSHVITLKSFKFSIAGCRGVRPLDSHTPPSLVHATIDQFTFAIDSDKRCTYFTFSVCSYFVDWLNSFYFVSFLWKYMQLLLLLFCHKYVTIIIYDTWDVSLVLDV